MIEVFLIYVAVMSLHVSVVCRQSRDSRQQSILHMLRASFSSQTLNDGRDELHELSYFFIRGSLHEILDVEEEQGDIQGHDQIREDTEMGEEDELDDSVDDEDSVEVQMRRHGGGGRPPRRRKFMPI